jgi:hypothetical protein
VSQHKGSALTVAGGEVRESPCHRSRPALSLRRNCPGPDPGAFACLSKTRDVLYLSQLQAEGAGDEPYICRWRGELERGGF